MENTVAQQKKIDQEAEIPVEVLKEPTWNLHCMWIVFFICIFLNCLQGTNELGGPRKTKRKNVQIWKKLKNLKKKQKKITKKMQQWHQIHRNHMEI